MTKYISHLGFFIIPAVALLVTFVGFFSYYSADNRLTTQLSLTSKPGELMDETDPLNSVSKGVIIKSLNSVGFNKIAWVKPLNIDTDYYQKIELSVNIPENYRGLSLIFKTDNSKDSKFKQVPILYHINGVVSFNVKSLVRENERIQSLAFLVEHEPFSPIELTEVRVFPKTHTPAQFASLVFLMFFPRDIDIRSYFSEIRYDLMGFSPVNFMVIATSLMVILMILVYGRVYSSAICIFTSMGVMLTLLALILVANMVRYATTSHTLSADSITHLSSIGYSNKEIYLNKTDYIEVV